MKYKVYVQGNAVVIEDLSGNRDYIGLNFFSYEIEAGLVQLLDSSLEKTVLSIAPVDFTDQAGLPVGDENDIGTYLSTFTAPAGTVTLDPGAQVELVDGAGNPTAIQNFAGSEVTKGYFFMGEDSGGFAHRVRTTEDGRLISTAQVSNPPGSTPVVEVHQGNVGTTVDNDYLIPTGENLVLQNLSAGAEGDVDGNKVELWYYTDGTKTTGQLISALYVNGSNATDSLAQAFTGDGSAIITLRRTRLAGSSREIFGKWQGYYYS
ncbi:MAG: hypothetical protein ACYTBJ_22820 [Planctomycetota bacterium]|jgi:hypothetical protein